MEWTAELTVGFVSLPPEMEEAYWAALHYFAEVMFADLLTASSADSEAVNMDEEEAWRAS